MCSVVVYPVFAAKAKCLVNVSFVFDSVLSVGQVSHVALSHTSSVEVLLIS